MFRLFKILFIFLMNQLLISPVCFWCIPVMTLVSIYFPHFESRPDVRHSTALVPNSLMVKF